MTLKIIKAFLHLSMEREQLNDIGCTVKCKVWRATLSRKVTFHSLDDFSVAAKKLGHNVEIIKASAIEVSTEADKLKLSSYLANSRAI